MLTAECRDSEHGLRHRRPSSHFQLLDCATVAGLVILSISRYQTTIRTVRLIFTICIRESMAMHVSSTLRVSVNAHGSRIGYVGVSCSPNSLISISCSSLYNLLSRLSELD